MLTFDISLLHIQKEILPRVLLNIFHIEKHIWNRSYIT